MRRRSTHTRLNRFIVKSVAWYKAKELLMSKEAVAVAFFFFQIYVVDLIGLLLFRLIDMRRRRLGKLPT